MSAEAVGWTYRHSPHKGATFAVHLALADSANDLHGFEVWASQASIAAKARCSRTTTNEAIAELVAGGLLELVERRAGRGLPNRYRFLMPAGLAVTFNTGRGGVPVGDKGVQPQDTPLVPRGDTTTQATNTTQTERARAAQIEAEEFDRFWDSYPRQVGKPDARRAFTRARKRATLEQITDGLADWLDYWITRDEAEFVAHPATWLNQDRWNDTPPEIRPARRRMAGLDVLDQFDKPPGDKNRILGPEDGHNNGDPQPRELDK